MMPTTQSLRVAITMLRAPLQRRLVAVQITLRPDMNQRSRVGAGTLLQAIIVSPPAVRLPQITAVHLSGRMVQVLQPPITGPTSSWSGPPAGRFFTMARQAWSLTVPEATSARLILASNLAWQAVKALPPSARPVLINMT